MRTQDRAGKIIEYSFDALDRSTAERWQSGTTTPALTVATTQNGGPVDEVQSVRWSSSVMGMSGTYTQAFNAAGLRTELKATAFRARKLPLARSQSTLGIIAIV